MKIVLYVSLAVIILLISFLLYFNILLGSVPLDKDVYFEIKKGTSTEEIIKELNQIGLLKPHDLFYLYLGFVKFKDNTYIQAGYYHFPKGFSNDDVIISIINGTNLYSIKVTLPEGMTIREYAGIFSKKLNIDSAEFIELSFNKDFLLKQDLNTESAEGYVFPSTYQFLPNTKIDRILSNLIKEQNKNWKAGYKEQAELLKMSKHQILTLASIIEAETPLEDEKARVSGLYHNRLNKGMLLQADPTVQYALGNKKALSRKDLNIISLYNTYKYRGLPPGPINNPSISSIIAALYPEENHFTFMVATGDGSGRHNFSENYHEHLKFVKDFKKNKSLR